MTVTELYNYCKKLGAENDEIQINYSCGDDYYDLYDEPVNKEMIKLKRHVVSITCTD